MKRVMFGVVVATTAAIASAGGWFLKENAVTREREAWAARTFQKCSDDKKLILGFIADPLVPLEDPRGFFFGRISGKDIWTTWQECREVGIIRPSDEQAALAQRTQSVERKKNEAIIADVVRLTGFDPDLLTCVIVEKRDDCARLIQRKRD